MMCTYIRSVFHGSVEEGLSSAMKPSGWVFQGSAARALHRALALLRFQRRLRALGLGALRLPRGHLRSDRDSEGREARFIEKRFIEGGVCQGVFTRGRLISTHLALAGFACGAATCGSTATRVVWNDERGRPTVR